MTSFFLLYKIGSNIQAPKLNNFWIIICFSSAFLRVLLSCSSFTTFFFLTLNSLLQMILAVFKVIFRLPLFPPPHRVCVVQWYRMYRCGGPAFMKLWSSTHTGKRGRNRAGMQQELREEVPDAVLEIFCDRHSILGFPLDIEKIGFQK